ncbi:MAG: MarR family transcriptional regulator, partial [Planctomycetota bacterium]
LIDRLEKVGFVERKRCLEDRRVIFVNITPTGLKTLADIDAPLQTLQARLLNHLTHSEKLEAIRLLDLCRAALP